MADLEIIKTLGTEVAYIREIMHKHGNQHLLKKNEYFCGICNYTLNKAPF